MRASLKEIILLVRSAVAASPPQCALGADVPKVGGAKFGEQLKGGLLKDTPQSEMIAKLIPQTLFYVTEMGFSKK